MRDRCIGMHFDPPKIVAEEINKALNRTPVLFTLDTNSRIIYHIGLQASFFYFEKITPYLFSDIGQPPKKADGQCGDMQYLPIPIEEYPSSILWSESQFTDPK